MMSICVEVLPLFGSREGSYPARTIHTRTTNLALVVIEALDRFFQRGRAVIIDTSSKLDGLLLLVSTQHAQQLAIHCFFTGFLQQCFRNPIRSFNSIGAVVRILFL